MPFQLRTGVFIREYLIRNEEANPYEVFKELRKTVLELRYPNRRPTYQSVRNYFYWLEKLGLIEFSREGPPPKPNLIPKRYYKLTEKGRKTPANALEWSNPRRALYPESWDKHHK